MPKAPVYKYRYSCTRKDHVGPNFEVREVEPVMLPVAQAEAVKSMPDRELRLGVYSAIGAHSPTYVLRCCPRLVRAGHRRH